MNCLIEHQFNVMGVLRLDLKIEYEKEEVITKVPNYAIERMSAASGIGFTKSDNFLVGTHDGYSYKDYWTIHK